MTALTLAAFCSGMIEAAEHVRAGASVIVGTRPEFQQRGLGRAARPSGPRLSKFARQWYAKAIVTT